MAEAPIYQLSAEILVEIFLWTQVAPSHLQDHPFNPWENTRYDLWFGYSDLDSKMRIEATTLDISQTCSHWRNIVISIPSLWSRISVDLNGMESKFVDLLRLYIQRSSPALLPLKFRGYMSRFGLSSINRNAAHILQVIVEQKHRWRVVDFGQTTFSIFTRNWNHLAQPATDCPRLEILHMPSMQTMDSDEARCFGGFIGTSPKLHTLFCDRACRYDSFPETISLSQVKTLKFAESGSGLDMGWGQLLQDCPNIQNLCLTPVFFHLHMVVESIRDSFALPYLHSLDIDLSRCNADTRFQFRGISRFLATTKVPSLSTLQLRGGAEVISGQTLSRSLKTFLQNSGCQLRRLQLSGEILTTQIIIELLGHMPTLEELTVDGGHNRLPLFEALTFSPGSWSPDVTFLLPCLTKLEVTLVLEFEDLEKDIDHGGPEPDLDDVIYTMVRSRRDCTKYNTTTAPVASLLRRFKLSVSKPPQTSTSTMFVTLAVRKWLSDFRSTTFPRLRELARYGLQLELDVREV